MCFYENFERRTALKVTCFCSLSVHSFVLKHISASTAFFVWWSRLDLTSANVCAVTTPFHSSHEFHMHAQSIRGAGHFWKLQQDQLFPLAFILALYAPLETLVRFIDLQLHATKMEWKLALKWLSYCASPKHTPVYLGNVQQQHNG